MDPTAGKVITAVLAVLVVVLMRYTQKTLGRDYLVSIPNQILERHRVQRQCRRTELAEQQDFYIGIDQDLHTANGSCRKPLPPPLCLSQQALGGAGLLVNEIIQEQYVALRLRARVYVMVVRHEKLLESDGTERIVKGFAEAGISARRCCTEICPWPAGSDARHSLTGLYQDVQGQRAPASRRYGAGNGA